MPLDYLPNSGSQLDRALRAYFISAGAMPNPNTSNKGIFLTLETAERTNPLRTILAHDAIESVRFTGCKEFMVTITDQFDGMPQQGEHNPEQRRIEIDKQLGKMRMAMAQADDNADNLMRTARLITDAGRALATTGTDKEKAKHEDMAEFTCLFVEDDGMSRGHPKGADGQGTDETTWREITRYKITVCPSAIIGYSMDPDQ